MKSYGKNAKEIAEVYKTIQDLYEKYKDVDNVCFDELKSLGRRAEGHLYGVEFYNQYGIELKPGCSSNYSWYEVREWIGIGLFGEKYRRTISRSDDGNQPEDGEMLMNISFPTGGYIFGEPYNKEVFTGFFAELKEYKPKYIDTVNNNLYYEMKDAKSVLDNFDNVLVKHRIICQQQREAQRIEKLEQELAKLKSSKPTEVT